MRSRAKRGNQNDERMRERHRNCVNMRDVWLKCRIMSHAGQTASTSPGILDPIGKPVATAHDQSAYDQSAYDLTCFTLADMVRCGAALRRLATESTSNGIGSVLGFGGMLPDGEPFTVIIFPRVPIPTPTADMFPPIPFNLNRALLPLPSNPL